MAREHIEGEHAVEPVKACALCPACKACGGRGSITTDHSGTPAEESSRYTTEPCKPCAGTGSQKGGRG